MIPLIGLSVQDALVQPIGVCRIDAQGASCWSFSGAEDPDLTRQIDKQAREIKGELAFVPGRKNRFLIVRQKPVTTMIATSSHGQAGFFPMSVETGESLVAYRVASPFSASTSTVTLRLSVPIGEPVEMPFREESQAKVTDVSLVLGKAVPSSQWMSVGLPGSSVWRFGVDRTETSPMGDLAFEAIGRDGKGIRYVDAWGRPYDTAKGDAIWKQIAAGKWDWRTPPDADLARIAHELGSPSLWYAMNVDPKMVYKLRVRRLQERTETIGPFVLDPIQSRVP